jgi:hypothetical protein
MLVVIWLPPSAPNHMGSPNSWVPNTDKIENILTL